MNCRNMESAVWSDSRVAALLNDDYVLVSLFVDDKTALDTPIEIEDPKDTIFIIIGCTFQLR